MRKNDHPNHIFLTDSTGGFVDLIRTDEGPILKEITYNGYTLGVNILDGNFTFKALEISENRCLIGKAMKVEEFVLHPKTLVINTTPFFKLENLSDEIQMYYQENTAVSDVEMLGDNIL